MSLNCETYKEFLLYTTLFHITSADGSTSVFIYKKKIVPKFLIFRIHMHGLWKTTVIKWNTDGYFSIKNLKQWNSV